MANNIYTKRVLVEKYDEYKAVQDKIRELDEEISDLNALKDVMVGNLYPGIISDKICELKLEQEEMVGSIVMKIIRKL